MPVKSVLTSRRREVMDQVRHNQQRILKETVNEGRKFALTRAEEHKDTGAEMASFYVAYPEGNDIEHDYDERAVEAIHLYSVKGTAGDPVELEILDAVMPNSQNQAIWGASAAHVYDNEYGNSVYGNDAQPMIHPSAEAMRQPFVDKVEADIFKGV